MTIPFGAALLAAAALVHYANALWSIYARRSLHLARCEWAQLALGLCIPILLIHHVVSTRVALTLTGFDAGYDRVRITNSGAVTYRTRICKNGRSIT